MLNAGHKTERFVATRGVLSHGVTVCSAFLRQESVYYGLVILLTHEVIRMRTPAPAAPGARPAVSKIESAAPVQLWKHQVGTSLTGTCCKTMK